MISLEVTTDYERLVPFFIENELEFTDDEPVPTDLVKCWQVTDEKDKLLGGAVLALREKEYIIDGIAVDPALRGENIGRKMLNEVIKEVKKLGGDSIYLVARSPGFFYRNGFDQVDKCKAPNFFECLTCSQFEVSCHPEVMRLEV